MDEENKLSAFRYDVDGTAVLLKTDFNVSDWKLAKRIDEIMTSIPVKVDGGVNIFDVPEDVISELFDNVLLTTEGKPVPPDLKKRISLPVALEILLDFFLIYAKLKNDILVSSNESEKKAKALFAKLKQSKTDAIQTGNEN